MTNHHDSKGYYDSTKSKDCVKSNNQELEKKHIRDVVFEKYNNQELSCDLQKDNDLHSEIVKRVQKAAIKANINNSIPVNYEGFLRNINRNDSPSIAAKEKIATWIKNSPSLFSVYTKEDFLNVLSGEKSFREAFYKIKNNSTRDLIVQKYYRLDKILRNEPKRVVSNLYDINTRRRNDISKNQNL